MVLLIFYYSLLNFFHFWSYLYYPSSCLPWVYSFSFYGLLRGLLSKFRVLAFCYWFLAWLHYHQMLLSGFFWWIVYGNLRMCAFCCCQVDYFIYLNFILLIDSVVHKFYNLADSRLSSFISFWERCVEVSTFIVDLFFSPFTSISFCFMYFVILLHTHIEDHFVFLVDWFFYHYALFFVSSQFLWSSI